ncbi:hypothetical protein [Shimazuella alba]|uniref:Uncharacterized protein n=1 Tax=Shimazuella alba TaxID=2690964 RepID=A0A6I4VP61_9BACL|nr:hypothetical protein [Shimazuella alba]MXQ52863.1 hypothetical protein [Shimazuella alba]
MAVKIAKPKPSASASVVNGKVQITASVYGKSNTQSFPAKSDRYPVPVGDYYVYVTVEVSGSKATVTKTEF